jgi:hypothetical protein
MRQQFVSFALTKRQELSFEEFTAFAHRFLREVPGLRVAEILLDGLFDARKIGRP